MILTWPTKGFEHSCLLSVGGFGPVNDISELAEHLSLKTKGSTIRNSDYFEIQRAKHTHLRHFAEESRKYRAD